MVDIPDPVSLSPRKQCVFAVYCFYFFYYIDLIKTALNRTF